MRVIAVIVAAGCGALLDYAGAWVVHHDSINYRLPVPVSTAAETAFALGPVLWVVGLMLAIPLAMGFARHVRRFWRLVALHALAYFTLACCLGSASTLALLGFLGATLLLWALAVIWAVVSLVQSAQPGASPNGGPAPSFGNSHAAEGPPSAS
jgi:hypothetical protein